MTIYDSGDMAIKRGDSLAFGFMFYVDDADTEEYVPAEGDILTYTVRKNMSDEKPAIRKVLSDYNVSVTPAETETLLAGTYSYDINLALATGGNVRIGPYSLVVTGDATRRGDTV